MTAVSPLVIHVVEELKTPRMGLHGELEQFPIVPEAV
jgi:hypothetical protein